MTDKKFILMAALLLAACTADPVTDETPGGNSAAPVAAALKLANTPFDAEKGELIVCFDDAAIPDIEAAAVATRSNEAATRAGIASVDDVLADLKVTSLRRLFRYAPRYEADTRAAGLHRWYVVEFDKEADLEQAALKLAAVGEVQSINFNTRIYMDGVGESSPLKASSAPATRALGLPFNDPFLYKQWHYINNCDQNVAVTSRPGADINVRDAWALTTGDPRVIVAVVDEGVKYSHPDLAQNMWVNPDEIPGNGIDDDGNGYIDDVYGYNFIDEGPITWTNEVWNDEKTKNSGDKGHGTHVAGTIAAVNNNGVGVSGIAGGTGHNDGVKIMSCQVFSADRGGTNAAIAAEAIKYAADQGAVILQCSWGSTAGAITSDDSYEENPQFAAIRYFMGKKNCEALDGGVVIFSAGNDSKNMSGYPGAYRDYISVTAIGPDFLPASYTNFGPGCNIAAPGGDTQISSNAEKDAAGVLSTMPSELSTQEGSDYGYMQGTSMACPHVSGVAALGLSYALKKGKHFTADEFKDMLLTSVNDLEVYLDGTKDGMNLPDFRGGMMGTGAIDAYQLLMQVEGTPCLKAKVGVKQQLPLTAFFGGGAETLNYTGVEMSQADMDKLGITTPPVIAYGKLEIKCTKPGTARITIKAFAGTNIGSGSQMGGIEMTKEFAIIARTVESGNGGWL